MAPCLARGHGVREKARQDSLFHPQGQRFPARLATPWRQHLPQECDALCQYRALPFTAPSARQRLEIGHGGIHERTKFQHLRDIQILGAAF